MSASMKLHICFFLTRKHILFIFLYQMKMYSLCPSFKTIIMIVLTIFIMEQEKITFFQWSWPHQFSPWSQNDPDLTFNLCSRSKCFWNTDAYKSLSLYNSNEGSCVAVCCICHILEQMIYPHPIIRIYYRFLMFIYTHNFRPLYKPNVQEIRQPTSRKWNGGCSSFIWYQETFLPLSASFSKKNPGLAQGLSTLERVAVLIHAPNPGEKSNSVLLNPQWNLIV